MEQHRNGDFLIPKAHNLFDKMPSSSQAKEPLLYENGEFMDDVITGKACGWVNGLWNQFNGTVADLYEMGRADPRKFIFAVKVGFTLALVSFIIFCDLVESATRYSIWAILTVIVVFEFSVGATLSKGFNRGLGTLSAGGLALGIAELAVRSGSFQEVILVASIFWAGFLASYIKLYPTLKQYEYGCRVFLLTFSLVLITGNTSSNFYQTAFYRLILIAIGAFIALTVNILVFPFWAGEDLHKLVVKNFHGVATSLEVCVDRYVKSLRRQRIPSTILTFQADDDPLYVGYRAAVYSYSQEESLMEFATWEPPHGPYKMFKYPWKNYVKVAGALRHCTFTVMAMHGCILSVIQASQEKRQVFANELQRVGSAGAKVLNEIGNKLERMEKLSPGELLEEVRKAAEELQMKIDKNSHVLVNTSHWEKVNCSKECTDHQNHTESKDEENGTVLKSISESSSSAIPEESTVEEPWSVTIDQLESGIESMHMGAITGPRWPSLYAIQVNTVEVRTAESASSLSLATFASLLMEFVARLDYVVRSFEELSELAKFKDQGHISVAKKDGWWTKLKFKKRQSLRT